MAARTGLFVAPLPGNPPQGTAAQDGRIVLGALFGTAGGPVVGNSWSVSSSGMGITVLPTVWRIPDATVSSGITLSPADTWTFNLAAGPASGSRIDVLWVNQHNYENGDSDSRLTYGIAQGTAAASPATPGVPVNSMTIATVTVPQGASTASACSIGYAFAAPVNSPFIVQDEVSYGFQNGFQNNNTGLHSTKMGRIVDYQFNVLSNGALSTNSPVFYWNNSDWAPAVTKDFTCQVRNSGGGDLGTATVYHSTDGNLYFRSYIPIGGSSSSTLPAASLLVGGTSYRSAR